MLEAICEHYGNTLIYCWFKAITKYPKIEEIEKEKGF